MHWKRTFLSVVTGFIFTLPYFSLEAAPPTITLEVLPQSIQLAVNEETDVLVMVRNTTGGVLSDMKLSSISVSDLTLSIPPPESAQLQPDSSAKWLVHVKQTKDENVDQSIQFYLDYTWEKAATDTMAESISGLATAVLEINQRALSLVSDIAQVQVQSTLKQIQDNQQGTIYLVVSNKSALPLKITSLTPKVPDFIIVKSVNEIDDDDPDENVEHFTLSQDLLPAESRSFAILIQSGNAVKSGDQILLFEVNFEWTSANQKRAGTLIASHQLTAGVLGESIILQLLGVPSFLLVPGFLIMAGYAFLRRRVSNIPPIELSKAEIAVISITLSLFAALLYPIVTPSLIHERRDYLIQYGLQDIFFVWVGSLFISIVAWLLMGALELGVKVIKSVINRFSKWWTQRQINLKQPSVNDKPIDALRKLLINELEFPQNSISDNSLAGLNSKVDHFRVSPDKFDDTWVWAQITYETKDPELGRQVESMKSSDDVKKFFETKGWDKVTLNWRDGEKPKKFPKGTIQDGAPKSFIAIK